MKISTLLFCLIGLAPSAFAQQTLEYPGGPHSEMTAADAALINRWVDQAGSQLTRLEKEVRMMSDEVKIRDKLYSKLKEIAGSTAMRPSDLLLRQALYTGVTLVDIIERQAKIKIAQGDGKVAGTIAKESLILKKVLKMAKDDYFVSDQKYIDGALKSRGHVYYNDKLVEFGMRIAKFIYDRSVDVQMVSATASYGMLRCAIGILNRKLLEDDRNAAFRTQILDLEESLQPFPALEVMNDDVEATLLLVGSPEQPGLRFLAQRIFEDVQKSHEDILE